MYQNYIFDLYGTLVDIHTDENQRLLWHRLTDLYRRFGADYPEGKIRGAYNELCGKEHDRLLAETGSSYPEIDLYLVFDALYKEAPEHHDAELVWGDASIRMIGATFRSLATKRFRVFPKTKETLKKLHEKGCGVYLLSNAQHVFTRSELEMSGLLPLFDAAYISSDARIKKPDPNYMGLLLKEQHLDPKDCVMVGNEIGCDLGVAAASGVDGILLNTPTNYLTEDEIEAGLVPLKVKYPDFRYDVIEDGKIAHLLEK